MADHIARTIEDLAVKIEEHERKAAEMKRVVNQLCGMAGLAERYDVVESSGLRAIRADEYYKKPLATAITMVLDRRHKTHAGPALVKDIFESLLEGGYKFETKNDENAKRSLYSSLSKNPKFHKLPNEQYGLTEWYPMLRDRTAKNGADEDAVDDELETQEAAEKKEELAAVVADAVADDGAAQMSQEKKPSKPK